MSKLKKWHRLGVVLSIVWLAYSLFFNGGYEYKPRSFENDFVYLQMCAHDGHSYEVCKERLDNEIPKYFGVSWKDFYSNGLLPLIGAWVLVFVSIFSYRWIIKGK